jgi:hypothetical protein
MGDEQVQQAGFFWGSIWEWAQQNLRCGPSLSDRIARDQYLCSRYGVGIAYGLCGPSISEELAR